MFMWRLCVAGGLLMLSACGQKGALYLPEPTREVVPAASGGTAAAMPPAAPTAAAQKDKQSEESQPSAGTP
jgi:predicted small lipoprotein YifL